MHGEATALAGRTRLVPVTWSGDGCRITAGHDSAFLRGAAVDDAPAAPGPDWTDGSPARLLLPHG
ncbi:hypothetical protein AB0G79_13330 [Streptomyces sp. NPDC020807]|uniref:hypothetical protein n=1 Tax=Streptomyces sp. NPDC020807 TaxID=3155119 RepID=UPI00340478C6